MSPEQLVQPLLSMPSRHAQVLRFRLVDGRSREDSAQLYGLTSEQFDVLLYRAARDFQGDAAQLPDEQLLANAATFAAELEQALAGEPAPALATALASLTNNGIRVQQLLDEAAARADASPARTREQWLRRVAIVVVLGLTAYFYWQQREREANKPRFEPRNLPTQTR